MKSSSLQVYALRLRPHQDLKRGIVAFAKRNAIGAGLILTCVGSVEQFHLRYANRKKGKMKKGFFEITNLCGTFSNSSAHLHLTVADRKGKTQGGHLMEKTLIFTTAEIVVGKLSNLEFSRVKDKAYGYLELSIRSKKS